MNRIGARLPKPAIQRSTSVVHVLGPWESVIGGIQSIRCTHCGELQGVRFPQSTPLACGPGDRIVVHANGLRERTDGAVNCERVPS